MRQDESSSDLPEGFPKLQKINDHKGNLDFIPQDNIPEHLTDVNDRNEWFEENMVFWNRYVEFEDLVADQKYTAQEKADENLHEALQKLRKNLNASQPSPGEKNVFPDIASTLTASEVQTQVHKHTHTHTHTRVVISERFPFPGEVITNLLKNKIFFRRIKRHHIFPPFFYFISFINHASLTHPPIHPSLTHPPLRIPRQRRHTNTPKTY